LDQLGGPDFKNKTPKTMELGRNVPPHLARVAARIGILGASARCPFTADVSRLTKTKALER
jgi:hypothetical protein